MSDQADSALPPEVLENLNFWRLNKIKNPGLHGGFKKPVFFLLLFFSLFIPLFGWIAGAAITLQNKTVVKKAQGKYILISTTIYWAMMTVLAIYNSSRYR